MSDYFKKFEKIIIMSLVLMVALVLFLSVVDLGLIIVKAIITPPLFLLDINELLDIFGLFLLILIGIELLESVKTYFVEKEIHVEVVFSVALIAIARKVIVLDIKTASDTLLLGIAAVIIALSAGYYLLKQSHKNNASRMKPPG